MDSRAIPAPITASAAFGWMEIPLLNQSVSRGMFADQPMNETSPPIRT
jgi:hypothetical protein